MADTAYMSFEIISMVVLTGILLADVLLIFKRPHVPSAKESTLWVLFYAALAVVFGLLLLNLFGADKATEFYAGWLTEYSLSIDNLFVFIIIMAQVYSYKHYIGKDVLRIYFSDINIFFKKHVCHCYVIGIR